MGLGPPCRVLNYQPQNICLSDASLAQSRSSLSPCSNLFDEIQDIIGEIDSYSLSEMDGGKAFF